MNDKNNEILRVERLYSSRIEELGNDIQKGIADIQKKDIFINDLKSKNDELAKKLEEYQMQIYIGGGEERKKNVELEIRCNQLLAEKEIKDQHN